MLACTRRKSRADWVTTEYLRYGEDAPDAADHNLRGQVWRVFDQAGMVASEAHDYRGNLIESTRRLTQAYTGAVDWTALAEATTEEDRDDEADALLYAEVFTTTSTFDALGRPVETHPPRSSDGARATTHARAVRMEYNQGGLLARVEVQLGDDEAALDTYVDSITYNARRQRTGIVYGNGVETALSYDAESLRLTRLYTTREVATDTFVGQDLRYAYDAVGNITRMDDHAVMVDDEERMVHAGPQLMEPVVHAYTYDALDRLIAATGREHPGLLPTTTPLQPGSSGYDRGGPHPNDLAALEDYVEQYTYDAVGNFLTMQHAVPSETTHSWTRYYLYEDFGNRLTKTHGGDATGPGMSSYGYDEHGNMLSMPHLAEMDWNAYDELTRTDNGGGAGRVEHHFQYDAAGQRVRKVVEHYTSGAATLIEERVYFGGFELYRRRQGAGSGLDKEVVRELQTLHVMDGEQRVALVDTRTVEMAPEAEDPTVLSVEARTTRVVYQLGNHLGSACLEVDEDGVVVRYEEFHPYGSSALLYARSGEDEPKRYRFTGMECDDTGLQYHSARYYAPWLGRWTSTDPIGISDGPNTFAYCSSSPVGGLDRSGTQYVGGYRLPTTGPARPGPTMIPSGISANFGRYRSSGSAGPPIALTGADHFRLSATGYTRTASGTYMMRGGSSVMIFRAGDTGVVPSLRPSTRAPQEPVPTSRTIPFTPLGIRNQAQALGPNVALGGAASSTEPNICFFSSVAAIREWRAGRSADATALQSMGRQLHGEQAQRVRRAHVTGTDVATQPEPPNQVVPSSGVTATEGHPSVDPVPSSAARYALLWNDRELLEAMGEVREDVFFLRRPLHVAVSLRTLTPSASMIENAPAMTSAGRGRYTPGTLLVPAGHYMAYFGEVPARGHFLAIEVTRDGQFRIADQGGKREGLNALATEITHRGPITALHRIGRQQ